MSSARVLSKFVFVEPPRTALTKYEFETIVIHRKAFQILHTASLRPKWKTNEQLIAVDRVELSEIYVLYEFVGDVYNHLKQLGSRIIGPLVVLQSPLYKLKFPMRTSSTWAQSMNGKQVTGVSFSFDDEAEIRDKVLKLGGVYRRSISNLTSIIIVGAYNPEDAWFLDAVQRRIMIVQMEWLNKIYNAAVKFEVNKDRYFAPDFIARYRLPFSYSHPTSQPHSSQSQQIVPSQSNSLSLTSVYSQQSILSRTSTQAQRSSQARHETRSQTGLSTHGQITINQDLTPPAHTTIRLDQTSRSHITNPHDFTLRAPNTVPLDSTSRVHAIVPCDSISQGNMLTSQLRSYNPNNPASQGSERVEMEFAIRINNNVLLKKKYHVKKKYLS